MRQDRNNNMRQDRMDNVRDNIHTCKSGKLRIGSTTIDISEQLKFRESAEYRRDDIDKINVESFEKSAEDCKYKMVFNGADEIPFLLRNKHVCILNFASSKNPGGGFKTGAMAQEEALCNASNLWQRLEEHDEFYEYNRANLCDGLYTDGIIYEKDVVFFKNKGVNTKPGLADIITCAAPNWSASRRHGVTIEENNETLSRRIEQVLKVAIANGNKVLVLGAFGCGVFKNDPDYVANETYRLLEDCGYKEYFDEILFAMKDAKGPNANAFKKVFSAKK